MMFPGPLRIAEVSIGNISELLTRCNACDKNDFMISYAGEFFRGRRETRSVDGTWYRLRRMPPEPPALKSLPSPLPPGVVSMLESPLLRKGGLVYICGAPGSGKTTTASGTVVTRLRKFGGFAYTIEDPPEMPLNGWHGNGYCCQTWVATEEEAGWQESFRGVLRSQPVGTPSILYVGEVRDAESASALMRAAANGFLVVATGFGTDIISGLEALVRLAGQKESVSNPLANLLRLVIHQRIMGSVLATSSLASLDGSSPVAAKIRSGILTHLATDIQFQANQFMLGVNGFGEQFREVDA